MAAPTPYPQMPYERLTRSRYLELSSKLRPLCFDGAAEKFEERGRDPKMPDLFCESDRCEVHK
jgi:hypothetical protein